MNALQLDLPFEDEETCDHDALQHSQEEEIRDLHAEVQRLQMENQRLTEKLVNANISA